MSFSLKINNYRGIQSVSFKADGVCLLVGPNGSGKSTLLSAIELLKNSYQHGFEKALNYSGGSYGFHNFNSSPEAHAGFEIETADIRWELAPTVNAGGCVYPIPEKLKKCGAEIQKHTKAVLTLLNEYQNDYSHIERPLLLKRVFDDPSSETEYKSISEFVKILNGYHNYFNYHLWTLRKSGSQADSDITLQYGGQNAFSVLRNWMTSRHLRERYIFVKSVLREAFHQFFDDLDFESAGRTVSVRIFLPNFKGSLPVYNAPNGFLAALLHLMAACSAPDGGIIGIDEPENGLHPFAVKTILEALRYRAADKNLTILLATHSPFILNEFKNEPNRVFVMDLNNEKQLTPLDEICDPEWLKYFSLGDLYGNDFARQEKDL